MLESWLNLVSLASASSLAGDSSWHVIRKLFCKSGEITLGLTYGIIFNPLLRKWSLTTHSMNCHIFISKMDVQL